MPCGELHVVGDRHDRCGRRPGRPRRSAPTRATPSASWPVVGSSSTRTAGSMARTPASATSLRRDRSRSYGLVVRSLGEPDRGEAPASRARRCPPGGDGPGCAGRTRPRARPSARTAGRRGSGRRTRPSGRARRSDRSSVGGAVEQHAPGVRSEEAVEVLDQRRLARPVLAEDRDRLARARSSARRRGRPRRRPGSDGRARRPTIGRAVGPGPASRRRPDPRPRRVGRTTVARRRATPAGSPDTAAAAHARSPSATAASSKAVPEVEPCAAGEPDERRRRRARRDPRRWPARRPARSSAIARPARRGRGSGPSARGPPGRARRTGSRSRPGPAPRAGRRPPPSRPGRAGPSARRGRGRSCPSPRCWRSRPAAARRPTARTARGRRGGRSPAAPSVSSIRGSISLRGTPRFSSPKASSSRTVCFEADSWLAGVAKTIPTRPSSASAAAPRSRRRRRSRPGRRAWPGRRAG